MAQAISDKDILTLSTKIGDHEHFKMLGINLKFSLEEATAFKKKNKKNQFDGTEEMLTKWRKKTKGECQHSQLITALKKTVMIEFAQWLTKVKKQPGPSSSRASTSNAASDNKAGKSGANAAKKAEKPAPVKKPPQEVKKQPGPSSSKASTSNAASDNKAGKSGANAPKKAEKPAPVKKPPKEVASTSKTKDIPVKKTSTGEKEKSRNDNTAKATAAKMKVPEENGDPAPKIPKIKKNTFNQKDVTMKVIDSSGSSTATGNTQIGQQNSIQININK